MSQWMFRLLYTYKVIDPVRYQLEVLDPEAIVDGFVQGTLRDVVNTRHMDEVMHSRAEINLEVMSDPPGKSRINMGLILSWYKSRMPRRLRKWWMRSRIGWWQSSFRNRRRPRPSNNVLWQTANSILPRSKPREKPIRRQRSQRLKQKHCGLFSRNLEDKGTLGEQYIQVLIAQELRENSKWIISDGGTMPVIDFRESRPAQNTPGKLAEHQALRPGLRSARRRRC